MNSEMDSLKKKHDQVLVERQSLEEQIKKLLAGKWWEKDEKWIRDNIDRFADIEEFLK